MKKLVIAVSTLAVLAMPLGAFAAVTGSDHDLTATEGDVCENCHIPHQAGSTMLWARTAGTGYTAVGNLCWSCHSTGGPAEGLANDALDLTTETHVMAPGGTGAIDDCSGGVACHDVHTQNPNGTGLFLAIGNQASSAVYCQVCHDGSAPTSPVDYSAADALGDHVTAGSNHDYSVVDCADCHHIHAATTQTGALADQDKILRFDNTAGDIWGALCLECHETGNAGIGGAVSADQSTYNESTNDGTELRHPTTATSEGAHTGYMVSGCNECHTPHANSNPFLLGEDNTDSGYCQSCHTTGGTGPNVNNSHPTQQVASNASMNTGGTYPLPWANQIMESEAGDATADWPSATTNAVVCESCHSVHRNGIGGPFLRETNTGNAICQDCHSSN